MARDFRRELLARQPSQAALNAGKARADSLEFAVIKENVFSTGGAVKSLSITGSAAIGAGVGGVGPTFASSGANRFTSPTSVTFPGSQGFSIEVLCAVRSTTSLAGYFGLSQGVFSRSRGLLSFGGGSNRNIYFWGLAADLDSGVEWRVDGLPQHVIVTSDGGSGTPMRFYRDGALIASGTTPAVTDSVNPTLYVGDFNEGWIASPVATLFKCAYYSTGLSHARVLDLYRRPYQHFNSRVPFIYDLPVTSGFNPAWARGSNQLIGSGLYAS